jgi:hypothetical protein
MTTQLKLPQLTIADQFRANMGLVTEEQAAEILLLRSVDTLATWRSQKKGPAYVKLGKRVFYTVNDIAQWVVKVGQEQSAAPNASASMADSELAA